MRNSTVFRNRVVRIMISPILVAALFVLVRVDESLGAIPRPEHPRPQFFRSAWLNLNGEWKFAFDNTQSGIEKGWHKDPLAIDRKIVVPFCPESKLSGIGFTDFITNVWYHRTVSVPAEWKGSRVFLHFGAVDYDCRVWINGTAVGRHYGGYTSFAFDITDALRDGENNLVVNVLDDVRSRIQPAGKQSQIRESAGVKYTRTTGIWQTVWLEARPLSHIESVRIVPELDNSRFVLTPAIKNYRRGMVFQATLLAAGAKVATASVASGTGVPLVLDIKKPRIWSLSDPFLYDLQFELLDGKQVVDKVTGYAGLRKFHIEGNRFFLNNKPIFMRMVLDQGFYPDGIYTAPSDAALKADVELSLAVGFNSARLHQKVFEERFHYWADRLGYLTWGEFPDWGIDFGQPQAIHNTQREWREAVMRDLNHPSIVAWTPFNETSGGARNYFEAHRRAVQETVDLTRALDPTRPINDASGYVHVDPDIYSVHDYTQDLKRFQDNYSGVAPGKRTGFFINNPDLSVPYADQPFVPDEYGGTFWTKEYASMPLAGDNNRGTWGRGKSADQVVELVEKLTLILTGNPNIAGYCYTELYDIEQEVNGVYTYDRQLKFNAERLKKIFGAPAAIEARRD